jgi:hypothetical protein
VNPFTFDPSSLPASYVRVLRVLTTIGAILFAAATAYGWRATDAALSSKAHDIEAFLVFIKFIFCFVITAVSGTMALILTFLAVRCWTAEV